MSSMLPNVIVVPPGPATTFTVPVIRKTAAIQVQVVVQVM